MIAHSCIYCGEDRQVEQVGRMWFCSTCGKSWPQTDGEDKRDVNGVLMDQGD